VSSRLRKYVVKIIFVQHLKNDVLEKTKYENKIERFREYKTNGAF
jgi:hypothetical protein